MRSKKVKNFFKVHWQSIISAGIILGILLSLLFFRIGTITPGLALREVEFINSASSIELIRSNPLNLPLKLILFALEKFSLLDIATARSASAVFGLAMILLFYYIVRQFATRRIALLASFMFVVSSWFLQTARIALPDILLPFSITALLALGILINNHRSSKWFLLLTIVSLGLLIYVPGIIWLVVALVVWQGKTIKTAINKIPVAWLVIGGIVLIALLTPLILASINDIDVLFNTLLIPREFAPIEWLRRLLAIPILLVARGPLDPLFNLGRLPILGILSSVFMAIGVFNLAIQPKLVRTKISLLLGIYGVLLVVFNGPGLIAGLMPVVFIVSACGMMMLLQQWFTVFPNNPYARYFAVAVIALSISLTGVYNVRRYFIAWGGSVPTNTIFTYQIEDN